MKLLAITDSQQGLLLRGREHLQQLIDAGRGGGRGLGQQLLEGSKHAQHAVGCVEVWLQERFRLADHTNS